MALNGRKAREKYGYAILCKGDVKVIWQGELGRTYTQENIKTTVDLDEQYINMLGVSRSTMNLEFMADIDRETKILEVGCNIGLELMFLKRIGFKYLYGIELQQYAVDIARQKNSDIVVMQGDASNLPFTDDEFGMVFTSGVLIHISEEELPKVLLEIIRCSNRYIWGCESYAPDTRPVKFRGYSNMYWHRDYVQQFKQVDKTLSLLKENKYYPLNGMGAIYNMYLFEKGVLRRRLEHIKQVFCTSEVTQNENIIKNISHLA